MFNIKFRINNLILGRMLKGINRNVFNTTSNARFFATKKGEVAKPIDRKLWKHALDVRIKFNFIGRP